nr:hypothetical protein Iba_chr12aCG23630 [Ipomoea batatas]
MESPAAKPLGFLFSYPSSTSELSAVEISGCRLLELCTAVVTRKGKRLLVSSISSSSIANPNSFMSSESSSNSSQFYRYKDKNQVGNSPVVAFKQNSFSQDGTAGRQTARISFLVAIFHLGAVGG